MRVNVVKALFYCQEARSAIEARQFGDSFNLTHLLTNPNTLIECVQCISRAEKVDRCPRVKVVPQPE